MKFFDYLFMFSIAAVVIAVIVLVGARRNPIVSELGTIRNQHTFLVGCLQNMTQKTSLVFEVVANLQNLEDDLAGVLKLRRIKVQIEEQLKQLEKLSLSTLNEIKTYAENRRNTLLKQVRPTS